MLKGIIALVLLAHGIGHSMGLLQLFKVSTINPAWNGDSWLLSGQLGATATQIVSATLWIVAILGFTALAATVMGWLPVSWFAPLAIVSSIVSLVGIALFPIAFPTFSTIGAAVVDVVVLLAATWFQWTPSDLPA